MRIIYSTLIIILVVFFSGLIIYNIFINLRFKEGLKIPISDTLNLDSMGTQNYDYNFSNSSNYSNSSNSSINPSPLTVLNKAILENRSSQNSDSQNTRQIIAKDKTTDTIRTCHNTKYHDGNGGKLDALTLMNEDSTLTMEKIMKTAKLCSKDYKASLKAKKSITGPAKDQLDNIKHTLSSQKDKNKY